jgi:hypothetical protein
VQEPVSEALGQRRAAREDDIAKQCRSQVHVGAVDSINDDLVDSGILESDDLGLKEDFRSTKSL